MKLLLDTHTLIWAVEEPSKLGAVASEALQDPLNDLILSAGSIWELAIKVGLKKLALSLPYRTWIERAMTDLGTSVLPISFDHAAAQSELPWHHRDPFDRLLAAQAQVEGLTLVSADLIFDSFGVARLW